MKCLYQQKRLPHIQDAEQWQFGDINIYDKNGEKYIDVSAEGSTLHNLLKVAQDNRTCILFEGAPGIGKSKPWHFKYGRLGLVKNIHLSFLNMTL